jgi:hypothetical protein
MGEEADNKNMAVELLDMPEIKSTIAFLKKRIRTVSERKGMNDFFKKRQLLPVVTDYKKLELIVREMFTLYGLFLNDNDNPQVKADFEHVIEQLTDHVQGCLVRYKIDIEKEIASND